MTRPMSLAEFPRLPRMVAACVHDGLPAAIDRVAESGPASHAFLRHAWFAAAQRAYGGRARTLVVRADDAPLLALPLTAVGPAWLGIAQVPGSYWPFRGFPAADLAGEDVLDAALDALARGWRALRIGPVYEDDAHAAPLVARARDKGWRVVARTVARAHLFDLGDAHARGEWPRNSTLRKNRFHEKHLADHGALGWSMIDDADWPAAFDTLAAVEARSWQAGASDPKFAARHGAFWRAAAEDPVLAAMFHAALLTIDGQPAAFSFDLDAGPLRYAIANSYDPAFAKHSPGRLLYYRNLVDGLARGIARVDWGAGDSGYKSAIGAAPGPAIVDWLLLRPGTPALVAAALARRWR